MTLLQNVRNWSRNRCLSIALNRWINGRLLGTSKVGKLTMPFCLLDLSSCPAYQQVGALTDHGFDDNSDPCNPGHGSSLSSYCLHSRQKWFDSLIIIVMHRIIIIRFWEGNYVHNLLFNSWEIHHKKTQLKRSPWSDSGCACQICNFSLLFIALGLIRVPLKWHP